jgi:hypothetical protein
MKIAVEDDWLNTIRGKWARKRMSDSTLYWFTEEFDAVMFKMRFG